MEYKIKVKKKKSKGNIWNVYVYWYASYNLQELTESLNRIYKPDIFIWEYL